MRAKKRAKAGTQADTKTRRHKYTQNYPSERKDYPSPSGSPRDSEDIERKKPEQPAEPLHIYHPVEGNPEEGGKISPADAERISSEDFPPSEEPKEAA